MLIYCFKHETAYDLPISDWSSDVCSADLRGAGPLQCLRFSHRIARHQPVAFAGEMEEAGAAFEYLQPSIVQERNLAEGLALQKIGRASCRERVCQDLSISVVAVSSKQKIRVHE